MKNLLCLVAVAVAAVVALKVLHVALTYVVAAAVVGGVAYGAYKVLGRRK